MHLSSKAGKCMMSFMLVKAFVGDSTLVAKSCVTFAPCGLQECKNRAQSISWLEVVERCTKSGCRLFC